jgi:hypothetical protein
MTRDIDLIMTRHRIEDAQKWREEINNVPFIQFPSDWKVQVIPPFADAIVRVFRSIYLDGRNSLGYWGEVGDYYWEVYPYRGDVGRCDMNDIPELLRMIGDTQEAEDD